MAALAAELHEPDDTPRAAREPREFSAIQVCGLTLRSFFVHGWLGRSIPQPVDTAKYSAMLIIIISRPRGFGVRNWLCPRPKPRDLKSENIGSMPHLAAWSGMVRQSGALDIAMIDGSTWPGSVMMPPRPSGWRCGIPAWWRRTGRACHAVSCAGYATDATNPDANFITAGIIPNSLLTRAESLEHTQT